jgi:Protein of unknown function (DUF3168)
MALHTDLDTALYQRLTSTAGTALWGTRVYATQAPQGAALPYVIFDYRAGGDLNLSPSRLAEARYQIEVIADTVAQARQGAEYLEVTLHEQPLSVTSWVHLGTTQISLLSQVENAEGRQFWRRGATYRIRLGK